MPLVKCFRCGQSVSDQAEACPNPKCGLTNPADHAGHTAREAAQKAEDAAAKAARARAEAEERAIQADVERHFDLRDKAKVLERAYTCADCGETSPLGTVLALACPKCGNPAVVTCEMPGAGCDARARKVTRVSGRWLAICHLHHPCERCGELIDETRHKLRAETVRRRVPGPPSGNDSGLHGANVISERRFFHVDVRVCDALTAFRTKVESRAVASA